MSETEKHKEKLTPENASRRSFLNRLWAFFGVLALAEFSWLGVSTFNSQQKKQRVGQKDTIIVVGSMENFKPGTVTAIPQGGFYLACLKDGSFLALSRTCTHLGCSVPWDETQQKFICPCHGSTFSLTGEVLSAPAPRPLDFFSLRIENRIIKVNIARPQKRDRFEPAQATGLA